MITNATVTGQSTVVQEKGSIVSDMDREKVMLSIKNGKYYNLGEIGGRIWDLIGKPIQVANLVSVLTSEYEIDPLICEKHVISFLELMLAEGLIEIEKE